jgi:hypothetical protein
MNSATGFPEKRQRLEAFNLVASGGLTDSEKRIIKFEKALETIRAEESHIKDFVKSTKWFDLNGIALFGPLRKNLRRICHSWG